MYSNRKNASKKKEIRKYFADLAHSELIIFGKHHVAVRRISTYTISVSEAFMEKHFTECQPDDKLIIRIAKVLESHLSGYAPANMATFSKLKKRIPLQENESRRKGLSEP